MKNILLIYTGGTIGMQKEGNHSLSSFNFDSILSVFPELKDFDANVDHLSTKKAIDSSDMHPENWVEIAKIIEENYNQYVSFVMDVSVVISFALITPILFSSELFSYFPCSTLPLKH